MINFQFWLVTCLFDSDFRAKSAPSIYEQYKCEMWNYIVSEKNDTCVPVRLLKSFSDLYAYSFWKICHPVRLLQTVRLLETLE